MDNINKKALLLAVVFAMITTFFIYLYISNLKKGEMEEETMSVYFVVNNLSPRHKILESDIKAKNIKKDLVNTNAIIKKNDAVGKYLKESVYKGEQLLEDRLAKENDFLLSYNLKKNEKAISVNVNEQIQVANLLLPGDYVDVVASFEQEEIGGIKIGRYTKTIVQNIKILAVGQKLIFDKIKNAELPKTVTLAVNSNDAEKIIYATEYGSIRLVLRAVGDDLKIKSEGKRSLDFSN